MKKLSELSVKKLSDKICGYNGYQKCQEILKNIGFDENAKRKSYKKILPMFSADSSNTNYPDYRRVGLIARSIYFGMELQKKIDRKKDVHGK